LFAFAYMLETAEENNMILKELSHRIHRLEESAGGGGEPSSPRTMGTSRANLDNLKDYKMK